MKRSHYGGQAIIDGVMFRGKRYWALAVRRPNGDIQVERRRLNTYAERYPLLSKFPFRGILILIESMVLGMKALNISAKIATDDEDFELGKKEIFITFTIALIFAVGLFVVLPTWVTKSFDTSLGSSWMISLAEGLFRIFLFILYIAGISLIPDIVKVFQYHGAEHAVINAYEKGEELVPDKVVKYSPLHIRCGTSFILIVLILVIIAFALVGKPALLTRIISRIVLIPIVAAISYELVKLSAKKQNSPFVRAMVAPGLWLQKLTTRKPKVDQVEVGLVALNTIIELEEGKNIITQEKMKYSKINEDIEASNDREI